MISLLVCVAMLQAQAIPPAQTPVPIQKQLVGSWKLVKVNDRDPAGLKAYQNPFGFATFDDSGYYSMQLSRVGSRRKFAGEEYVDAKPAEKAKAFDEYAAYFAKFEVDEKKGILILKIVSSLMPNDIGQTFYRYYDLDGDTLTLYPATHDEDTGKLSTKQEATKSVVWKRVKVGDEVKGT